MGPIKHALIKVVVTRLAAVASAGLLLIFQHRTPKQLIHLQADCKALIFIDSVDIFYDPYAKRIFFLRCSTSKSPISILLSHCCCYNYRYIFTLAYFFLMQMLIFGAVAYSAFCLNLRWRVQGERKGKRRRRTFLQWDGINFDPSSWSVCDMVILI